MIWFKFVLILERCHEAFLLLLRGTVRVKSVVTASVGIVPLEKWNAERELDGMGRVVWWRRAWIHWRC